MWDNTWFSLSFNSALSQITVSVGMGASLPVQQQGIHSAISAVNSSGSSRFTCGSVPTCGDKGGQSSQAKPGPSCGWEATVHSIWNPEGSGSTWDIHARESFSLITNGTSNPLLFVLFACWLGNSQCDHLRVNEKGWVNPCGSSCQHGWSSLHPMSSARHLVSAIRSDSGQGALSQPVKRGSVSFQ